MVLKGIPAVDHAEIELEGVFFGVYLLLLRIWKHLSLSIGNDILE